MKKLLKYFANISLLALLIGVPTGCEKYEHTRFEYIHFYMNGSEFEMGRRSNKSIFSFSNERNAFYDTAEDALLISAPVNPVSTNTKYLFQIYFPNPCIDRYYDDPSSFHIETYDDHKAMMMISRRLMLDELQIHKRFAGFTIKDSKIVKKYSYDGGYVSGTFDFSGLLPDGEKVDVSNGDFVLRIYFK